MFGKPLFVVNYPKDIKAFYMKQNEDGKTVRGMDVLFPKIGEIIDLGVDYGVIKKAGSWFSYGDKKIGQGRDAVKELLKKDEALAAEIEQKVRDAMKNKKDE